MGNTVCSQSRAIPTAQQKYSKLLECFKKSQCPKLRGWFPIDQMINNFENLTVWMERDTTN
jgi:hypothetical protein